MGVHANLCVSSKSVYSSHIINLNLFEIRIMQYYGNRRMFHDIFGAFWREKGGLDALRRAKVRPYKSGLSGLPVGGEEDSPNNSKS